MGGTRCFAAHVCEQSRKEETHFADEQRTAEQNLIVQVLDGTLSFFLSAIFDNAAGNWHKLESSDTAGQ